MKNYFYNLPVELQEYIFDIIKSRPIVSVRATIKIKFDYIINLISNLIYNNTSQGIYLYPNRLINFQGGNSASFGMIYPICPYSSYTIHVLNIINHNLTDNIFKNMFILGAAPAARVSKLLLQKSRNYIIWTHFLNGLYNGLLYRNSVYEFDNILNKMDAHRYYLKIHNLYNLFRSKTINTCVKNLKVYIPELLNIPPRVSAFSVF